MGVQTTGNMDEMILGFENNWLQNFALCLEKKAKSLSKVILTGFQI